MGAGKVVDRAVVSHDAEDLERGVEDAEGSKRRPTETEMIRRKTGDDEDYLLAEESGTWNRRRGAASSRLLAADGVEAEAEKCRTSENMRKLGAADLDCNGTDGAR